MTNRNGKRPRCQACERDAKFLRRKTRPDYKKGTGPVRIVDLFCGCGGLSLGAAEGARRAGFATRVALAVDIDADACTVFRANFPGAPVVEGDVCDLFDGKLGLPPTLREETLADWTGPVDLLLSGAPCQGHSDLNNHTRRRDPRNRLYLRAARAAQILKPPFVLLENVPSVQHDSGRVVSRARTALEAVGYRVATRVVNLGDLGVPQTRRRHLLLACASNTIDPDLVLRTTGPCNTHLPRSLRWAIAELETTKGTTIFDTASIPTDENRVRIRWLFDNCEWNLPNTHRPECHHGDHSYQSMYGRLRWGKPAQTITTGFGSMGQGRYVHPSRRRTITPHEAARLQTFPDFFDFTGVSMRSALARVIGNAVPPLVTLQLVNRLLADESGEEATNVNSVRSHKPARTAPGGRAY